MTTKKLAKAEQLLTTALVGVSDTDGVFLPLKQAHSLSGFLTHVSFVVMGGTTFLRQIQVGASQVELSWSKATKAHLSGETVGDLRWWLAAICMAPRRRMHVMSNGTLAAWGSHLLRDRKLTKTPANVHVIAMDALGGVSGTKTIGSQGCGQNSSSTAPRIGAN